LTKKNQQASVIELNQVTQKHLLLSSEVFNHPSLPINQLVGLYGQDARVFLLSCLFDETDFRDAKSSLFKDVPKVSAQRFRLSYAHILTFMFNCGAACSSL
jgi:hypothetical protein